jgi:hypothetical protein
MITNPHEMLGIPAIKFDASGLIYSKATVLFKVLLTLSAGKGECDPCIEVCVRRLIETFRVNRPIEHGLGPP